MTLYHIELQIPYGTLISSAQTSNKRYARIVWLRYIKQARGKGFVPVLQNGKKIPPANLLGSAK